MLWTSFMSACICKAKVTFFLSYCILCPLYTVVPKFETLATVEPCCTLSLTELYWLYMSPFNFSSK